MKRLLSIVLSLVMVFGTLAATSVEASALDAAFTFKGSISDTSSPDNGEVNWKLAISSINQTAKLTISGDGYMYNAPQFPWVQYEMIYGIGITELVIEEGVKSIAEAAFVNEYDITSVNIPSTVQRIGDYAFAATALKTVTLPKSLTRFSANVFAGCLLLKGFSVDPENERYMAENGVVYSKDGKDLVAYPAGRFTLVDSNAIYLEADGITTPDFKIPAHVENIKQYAFAGNVIKNITIPGTVKNIEREAFESCPFLSEVIIKDGVQSINDSAFMGCTSLKYVNIPASVTYIGWWSFGAVQKYDFDSVRWMLDEKGIKDYTLETDEDLEYCVDMYLTDYTLDDFTMLSYDENFRVYAPKGSAAQSFAVTAGVKFYESALPLIKATKASASGNTVVFRWDISEQATSYCIYRKTKGASWAKIGTVDGQKTTTFTDENVVSGNTYYYSVRANNGSLYSALSPQKVSVLYLAAPGSLKVTNISSGIRFSWKSVAGAKKYCVYRKTNNAASWTNLGYVDGSRQYYTDTSVTSGNTYRYTVRAINGSTRGGFSETGAYATYIETPKISAICNADNAVKIKWNKVSAADTYYVYRKISGGNWIKIAKLGNTSSYTDKTATAGKTYQYTVRAGNSKGISSFYAGKTIKFLKAPALKSAVKVSTGIKLTYGKVEGAAGYYVYRKTANSGWSKIATVKGASTLFYIDKTAKAGTVYYYTVRGYSGSYWGSCITKGIAGKR